MVEPRSTDTLLHTKLMPPRVRSAVISRPALLARLNEGLTKKLTLVSAPTGSGKTTLIPKYGEKRMAIVSLSGEGLGALLIFLAPLFWMLYLIFFLQSMVVSFIFSALSTLAANKVADHEQGQLAGVSAAVNGLVAALGPLWAGVVYDQVMPGAPFWMGAILLGIACLLMAQVKVKASESRTASAFSAAD